MIHEGGFYRHSINQDFLVQVIYIGKNHVIVQPIGENSDMNELTYYKSDFRVRYELDG